MTKRLTKLGLVAGMLVLVACVDETPVAEQTGTGCTTNDKTIVLSVEDGLFHAMVRGWFSTSIEFRRFPPGVAGGGTLGFPDGACLAATSSATHLVVGVAPVGSELVANSDDVIDPCVVSLGDRTLLGFSIPLAADLEVTLTGSDGKLIGSIAQEQMADLASAPGPMTVSAP